MLRSRERNSSDDSLSLHAASTASIAERSQDSRFGRLVILISGQEKVLSPVSVVSINLGIWFYQVEIGDTGESIEPEESR